MVLLFAGVLVVLLAVGWYATPSSLSPTLWMKPNELRRLEGSLYPNKVLSSAKFLHVDEFMAPESMAIDAKSGEVYASLGDGRIALFQANGSYIRTVLFVGTQYIPGVSTISEDSENLMKFCSTEYQAKRLPWNERDEFVCGRPLGLRLVQETLYFIDAYRGVFQLNVRTGNLAHLVSPQTVFAHGPREPDSSCNLPPLFFNDLDVTKDGDILFTDSSHKHTRARNRQELLDAAPRGRLLVYSPSGIARVLVCGLHFPNGVQIVSPPSAGSGADVQVLVAETARFRILQIDLGAPEFLNRNGLTDSCSEDGSISHAIDNPRSPSKPAVKIFLDSAPGCLDNIREDMHFASRNSEGNPKQFLVGVGSLSKQPFSLLWFAYQYIWIRDFVGKFVPMKLVEHLVPPYGLVLVLDQDGNIVKSFHDPTGRVRFVSQADRHPLTGDLWIGSHSAPHITIVPSEDL